jgi:type IV secretory pathway VirB10-like protein
MTRLLAGTALLLTLSAAPAFAQLGNQSAQIEQLKSALQNLSTQFQTTTGHPLLGTPLASGPGTPASEKKTETNPITGGKPEDTEPQWTGPTSKVPIGYVATGVLTMTVNSDYPGPWRGHLTQPIYSIDNRTILFPEGTVIVGRTVRVGGPNEAINDRLGLMPTYLVRADGTPFKINQQAMLDELGIAGIPGDVDYHVGIQLAAIGAFVGVQALPNVVSAQGGATPSTTTTSPVPAFANQTSQAGENILQRYLTLVPTITVREGAPIRIFFQEEMIAPDLRPRDRFELTNIAPPPEPTLVTKK